MSEDSRLTARSDAVTAESTHSGSETETNIGPRERLASGFVGGALLFRGLRRGSVGGAVSALAGGALLYRGLTGRSRLYRALGADTAGDFQPGTAAEDVEAVVDTADPDRPTIERSITVDESADVLADYWRDPEHVSEIVGPFADVSGTTDERHNWRVDAPLGQTIEWETTVDGDAEDGLRWIADDAFVPHECTISFRDAEGDRGTVVTIETQYDPPGGTIGDRVMDRLGFGPKLLAGTALHRFKSLVETGEIPTTEANPSGRGKGDLV